MTQPWTDKEIASIVSTLKKHPTIHRAAIEHNRIWKTQRSTDSICSALERRGKMASDYLCPSRRISDAPLSENIRRLVDFLKRRPSTSVGEACDALDVSPKRLKELAESARGQGFTIECPTDDRIGISLHAPSVDRLSVRRLNIEPISGHIRFGVIADTHFASKMHRGECLADFAEIATGEYGVRRIEVAGDIFAGINMYAGQLNEIDCWGLDAQVAIGIKGLPKHDGLTWDIIGGNHDESLLKAAGADPLKVLASSRSDIAYHGFYSALIDLVVPGAKETVKIELFHPAQAGAYAITYHTQKAIEQIPGGMKPQLLFIGHEHQANLMPDYRGVSAFLCGCFEDQTLYLKRKHANPALGGWIVDVGISASGAMRTLTTTWIKYFHSARGAIRGKDGIRMDRSIGAPIG
jgi:hypothetical protein